MISYGSSAGDVHLFAQALKEFVGNSFEPTLSSWTLPKSRAAQRSRLRTIASVWQCRTSLSSSRALRAPARAVGGHHMDGLGSPPGGVSGGSRSALSAKTSLSALSNKTFIHPIPHGARVPVLTDPRQSGRF